MTQDDLLYRFRLRTFAMAAELGNVRAACRAMGIHPSTYYRWKRQLDRYGPEGAVASSDHPVRLPPLGHLNRADCGHDRMFRVVSWCLLVGEPPLRRA